jgi:fused signal recognition particle receptor
MSKPGLFQRLKQGLSRSANALSDSLTGAFRTRKLDDAALEELEDVLITADLGPHVAAKVTGALAASKFDKEVTDDEIRTALADVVRGILEPVEAPLNLDPANRPHVLLVVGVNGSGKTTTIGKIAKHLTEAGQKVVLGAGDTFRAAAIEQLEIWGQRTGVRVVRRDVGADPAAVAYEALEAARADKADVLIVDTAGRLQNKAGLMDELAKIVRVLSKLDETAPHDVLLVLDATTGQNAINQVEVFREVCNVTGLAMTKLDGTARGGVLVAIAEKFALPVHFVGVGESAEDLQPFDAADFARALAGLEN